MGSRALYCGDSGKSSSNATLLGAGALYGDTPVYGAGVFTSPSAYIAGGVVNLPSPLWMLEDIVVLVLYWWNKWAVSGVWRGEIEGAADKRFDNSITDSRIASRNLEALVP